MPAGAEKEELWQELDEMELFAGFIIPDDTTLTLTNIALGVGVSDLKTITKDRLVVSYLKAKDYGGAPHEYMPGFFTDRDKHEIDSYATLVGLEHIKKEAQDRELEARVIGDSEKIAKEFLRKTGNL